MLDPDDVTAVQLDYAIADLVRAARRMAYPDRVLQDWLHHVIAVLITGNWPGRTLEELMLVCARRVLADLQRMA